MVLDRSWLISGGSGGGDDGGGKDHRGWCTCCNMVASKKMKTDTSFAGISGALGPQFTYPPSATRLRL